MDTSTQQAQSPSVYHGISHISEGSCDLSHVWIDIFLCAMVKSPYIENDHPTFSKKSKEYINTYYWLDDHSLPQGNNRSLDQRVDLASGVVVDLQTYRPVDL